MKPSIADQLKEVKLNFSDYFRLPMREDVLVFNSADGIVKQWEKLLYLQKHLKTINRYIEKNKGEKLNDWLKTNNAGLSKIVLDKIGNHNNETGGISSYFFNLQNFYDIEEEKYDKMEESASMPDDLQNVISELRNKRTEKRTIRRKTRKLKMRDMKADGKGYLYVDVEEPPMQEEKKDETTNTEIKKAEEKVVDAVNKGRKNIMVWIAGITISIAVISIITSDKK